ncbi:MAG: DUF3460 family protein [Betaproteobacteria bacterium]|nr:DUF3460 family protein [Betaproteobacteria bacterium]
MYESEHTLFMRELFAKQPQLADDQQRGRAIWWDRPAQNPEARRRIAAARIKQKAYPYQV